MKHRSSRAAFVILPAAIALWQCRAPTQIALDLRVDFACASLTGVSIHAARTPEQAEVNAPSATTVHCENGRVGRIFLAPGGSDDGSVAVVVGAALGGDAEACLRGTADPGCIVARRRLRFQPNLTLVVPVLLRASCLGNRCATLTTCADGTNCTPSDVSACSSDNVCKLFADDDGAQTPLPGSDAATDAHDARGDASSSDASARDTGDDAGPLRVTQVALNWDNACALLSDGTVRCWGAARGLGDGSSVYRVRAEPVPGLSGVVQLSARNKTICARRATGSVVCWGGGIQGTIGDGAYNDAPFPRTVHNLSDAVDVSVGHDSVCAVRSGGSVACWGLNYAGMLGNDSGAASAEPVTVSGVSEITNVLAGDHNFVLRGTTVYRGWGENTDGELFSNATGTQLAPVDVKPLGAIAQAITGVGFSCVRSDVGTVSCWGRDNSGQLGDGMSTARPSPAAINAFNDAVDLATDGALVCAVRRGGTVVCWGYGYVGGGNGYAYWGNPSTASGLTDAVQVAVSPSDLEPRYVAGTNACAVRRAGGVVCWGDNWSGQIGDGTRDTRMVPTPVLGLP